MKTALSFALIVCAWPAWGADPGAAGAAPPADKPAAQRSAPKASEHQDFFKIERRAQKPARAAGAGEPAKAGTAPPPEGANAVRGGPKHDTVKNSISNPR
jgi:hypothetical protein